MLSIAFEYPLRYPAKHTACDLNMRGFDNGFPKDMQIEDAIGYLEDELKNINARGVKLHTNYKNIGNPRLREQVDRDTGCVLQFDAMGHSYVTLCDKWALVAHNIYAVHLLVRNAKNYEKWGVGTAADALTSFVYGTHKDYSAEDASAVTSTDWMDVLGLGPTATLEDANAVYRSRAKRADGDAEELIQLNNAVENARRKLV